MAEVAAPLVEALREVDGLVLVVTGAGVSAASGVSTFRGREPDAIWRQHDVEMATAAMFERDPVAQLTWYLDRFATLDSVRPNAGHVAIAGLERLLERQGKDFLLITQNIDPLHELAGSRRLIKVHGTGDRLRCGRAGCRLGAPRGSLPRSEVDFDPFKRQPGADSLPRCPNCSAPLRAHVLFFDEYYTGHEDYRFAEVEAAASNANLILFVGTSFSVGATSLMLQEGGRRGVPMFSIDPTSGRLPAVSPVRQLTAAAEDILPLVVESLFGG